MQRKAFTLIELLVVIAIIALLMGILMPALQRVKEMARQQTCASRVRQQLLASIMYAEENNGKLALPSTPGAWLHDLAINTVNYMMKNGMTREMFYCPSNLIEQKHNDYFWEFTTEWDGTKFINPGNTSFILSGYIYILQTTSNNRPEIRNEENKTGPKRWCTTIVDKQTASMELVVDAVASQPRPGTRFGYTFGEIGGGTIWARHQLYEQSNHLKDDEEPRGGNTGFLDGHVDWRPFDDMEDRHGSATWYWW